jgi:predicted N-acetyltransferase YhbS
VIELRPLLPDDVPAADQMATAALRAMSAELEAHLPLPDRTPEMVVRGQARIAHLQRTDPDGAWVAVDEQRIVGISLSLRRGPMWFLSLLAVATDVQAQGVGRRLLDAALRTSEGAGAAWILATVDPKALRRYALAGFAPHAGYTALGPLDRALVPAGLGVRDGDWSRDAGLVDDVVTALRGAPYGPDLETMSALPLLVVDEGADRGFATVRGNAVGSLGATSPSVAQRLLWAGLALTETPFVVIDWLTADQQWAIDLALSARLPLGPGPSSCRRTVLGPMTPYLPSGSYG